ncbi:hypothetical protein P7K49_024770 [Saguinus oedipus]|uniref:Uncharacterized protein n=1 Tax=Saguinus oedipus TaxID=9490 RepID=A0ABQ9UQF8_SAGOE|nr:hypothetical protein P7K49_024770 [Saguinus oedipus]
MSSHGPPDPRDSARNKSEDPGAGRSRSSPLSGHTSRLSLRDPRQSSAAPLNGPRMLPPCVNLEHHCPMQTQDATTPCKPGMPPPCVDLEHYHSMRIHWALGTG